MCFSLFLKINYLVENLIVKYMTVLRFLINRRSFNKSHEIVNHVESRRYRLKTFFAIDDIAMIKFVSRCVAQRSISVMHTIAKCTRLRDITVHVGEGAYLA